MPLSNRVTAWLEVDMDANPIVGTLRPCGGSESTFVGWLGLTASIARLRHNEPAPPAEEPRDVRS